MEYLNIDILEGSKIRWPQYRNYGVINTNLLYFIYIGSSDKHTEVGFSMNISTKILLAIINALIE